MNDAPKKLKIINMANVEPETGDMAMVSIYTIWKDNDCTRRPSEGKTTFILQLAALLSKAINYHLTQKNVNPSTLYTRQRRWLGRYNQTTFNTSRC